ncbi:TVP38/TMEM64 family protein [Plantactinospora sp. ZYX-F-223]|uniref:TVP38/TMEM64 family protein n=1 Tax=Plantactinospora sp. ZYX-F-223 TaxID=3144103 RepID=UPI0031FBD016
MIGRVRRLLRQRSVARFTVLLLVLGLFGLALLLVPRPEVAQLPRLADRLGALAPVAAIGGGALLLVALVPRTAITVVWGAIFGPLLGAGYTLAAALLAALAGFGVGRLLGREFVAERVRGRLARLDGWFARQSVLGVVSVRLIPIGGFGLISYGYGTTGARLAPFLLGSVLAATPSAFGYAAVGAAAVSPDEVNWLAVTPGALGLVATAVLAVRWWRAERAAGQARRSGGAGNGDRHVPADGQAPNPE